MLTEKKEIVVQNIKNSQSRKLVKWPKALSPNVTIFETMFTVAPSMNKKNCLLMTEYPKIDDNSYNLIHIIFIHLTLLMEWTIVLGQYFFYVKLGVHTNSYKQGWKTTYFQLATSTDRIGSV